MEFFGLSCSITLRALDQLTTLIVLLSPLVLLSLGSVAAPVLVLRGLEAGVLVVRGGVQRRGVVTRRPLGLHRITSGDVR